MLCVSTVFLCKRHVQGTKTSWILVWLSEFPVNVFVFPRWWMRLSLTFLAPSLVQDLKCCNSIFSCTGKKKKLTQKVLLYYLWRKQVLHSNYFLSGVWSSASLFFKVLQKTNAARAADLSAALWREVTNRGGHKESFLSWRSSAAPKMLFLQIRTWVCFQISESVHCLHTHSKMYFKYKSTPLRKSFPGRQSID